MGPSARNLLPLRQYAMRLLDRDSNGQPRLTDFTSQSMPRYAILSHTWEQEEVTFKDMQQNNYHKKAGYKKIEFCLKQAKTDGLQYCWMDTCCIDRSNVYELSVAINSMFRWYANAEICYVYLSDVSSPKVLGPDVPINTVPMEAFRSSRWFTRAWTLRELLAPNLVEFFSSDGHRIGDKGSLIQAIHERTQIPMAALRGDSLERFSVEERMSWISNRSTKTEEDMAYSVMGIFEIFMSLNYGEGRQSAESRLITKIKKSHELKRATDDQDFTLPFALPGAATTSTFIGRASELSQMREALPFSGRRETVVLHGLGGIGKTQLAIEYAKTRRTDYTAVFWLNGRDQSSLQQSFANAASRLGTAHASLSALKLAAEQDNASEAVDAVLHWLDDAGNDRWLLIIDGVDAHYITDKVDVRYEMGRYLPSALHGHIVITTQSSQLRTGKMVELQKMKNVDEGFQILQAASQRPELEKDTKVLELVERLDGLPLAISTAGLYLKNVAISPTQYLELCELVWVELQQDTMDLAEYQRHALQTTWEISRRQVAKDARSYWLLRLLGAFASQDIWYELLAGGRDGGPEWFTTVTKSRSSFNQHMKVLCDYGLVEAHRWTEGYTMRRYVHDWVREIFRKDHGGPDDGDGDGEVLIALRCISLAPSYANDTAFRAVRQRLLNHADNWLERFGDRELQSGQHGYLHNFGVLYDDQGRVGEAEAIYVWALQGIENTLGREHASTLRTINNLGLIYIRQGRLTEATEIFKRCYRSRVNDFVRGSPLTLAIVKKLGLLFTLQNRLVEAEAMFKQALWVGERTLGPENLDTLDTVTILGAFYTRQGRLVDAVALLERALERSEKAFGGENRRTLQTINNLGILYTRQGRLAKAKEMIERAQEGTGKIMRDRQRFAWGNIEDLSEVDNVYGNYCQDNSADTDNSGTLICQEQTDKSQMVSTEEIGPIKSPNTSELCLDSLVQTLTEADVTGNDSLATFRQTPQTEIEERGFCDLLCQRQELRFLCSKVTSDGLQARRLFEENVTRALKKLHLRYRESSTESKGDINLRFLRSRLRRRKVAVRIIDRIINSTSRSREGKSEDLDHSVEFSHFVHGHGTKQSDQDGQLFQDEQSPPRQLAVQLRDTPSPPTNASSSVDLNDVLTRHGILNRFLADLCLNFLPLHLKHLLEIVPVANLEVVSRERWSPIDSIKFRINEMVGSEWTWKPWTSGPTPVQSGRRRLILHCRCKKKLRRDVPLATAELLQMIIRLRQSSEPTSENWLRTISSGIKRAVGLAGGQSMNNTQGVATSSVTGSRYIPATSQSQRSQAVTNTQPNIVTGQASTSSAGQTHVFPTDDLWLVLGYQGSRPTLEIEHISVSDPKGDLDCCSELKQQYHHHRGFWRRWFSIWHLDSCQFVKFDKICFNAVTYHPDEWPQGHPDYKMEPVYASNGQPPISESHFRMYLDMCETARCCSWSIFHKCMAGTVGNSRWLIDRVPKKRSKFDYQRGNSGAIAWGLRPVLRLSLPRVIYYHIAIIAGPFAFWWLWLVGHPNDLQTAGVPLALVTAFVSMFWAAKDALHR